MILADKYKSHRLRWLLPFLVVLLLGACERGPKLQHLEGLAMGTQWHVTYVDQPDAPSAEIVQRGIADALERVEESMSTYRDSSAISRFNALPIGADVKPDPDFIAVLEAALAVGQQSGGSYDVTVGPLVDLWGFGATGRRQTVPAAEDISRLLTRIGLDKLSWSESTQTLHKNGEVQLDFSSLAKGYGVDVVAQWLTSQQLENFLVEVGGELRVQGEKPQATPWRVAIEQPSSVSGGIAATLPLKDIAIATSGDYRNFFEVDGERYSHTLDPRTGYPVRHNLVSVTVLHSSAMLADAWATALSVMGAEEAMRVAKQQGLAVYLIQRQQDTFTAQASPAFSQYTDAGDISESQ